MTNKATKQEQIELYTCEQCGKDSPNKECVGCAEPFKLCSDLYRFKDGVLTPEQGKALDCMIVAMRRARYALEITYNESHVAESLKQALKQAGVNI